MAIEIERKFLVRSDAWRPAVQRSVRMAQGYINDQAAMDAGRQRCSVRVRIAGDVAHLNLKSRSIGAARQEFEYPVPVEDAQALLALCVGGLVDKTRHYAEHGGLVWEIDEFLGDNAGLVVAEVELAAVDQEVALPPWAGREVTEQVRYYNLALATRPYSLWTDEERTPCS